MKQKEAPMEAYLNILPEKEKKNLLDFCFQIKMFLETEKKSNNLDHVPKVGMSWSRGLGEM